MITISIFLISIIASFISYKMLIVPTNSSLTTTSVLPSTTTLYSPQWVDRGCWTDMANSDNSRAISPSWINVEYVGFADIYNFINKINSFIIKIIKNWFNIPII